MKRIFLLSISFLSLISCNTVQNSVSDKEKKNLTQVIDSADMTNNFYDNVETYSLTVKDLVVQGEIANPGKVDFSNLPIHSVIVKEALLDSTGRDRFVGAYRYDGYSLFDILDTRIIRKSNSDDFKPIIDLFIEVENDNGEKVVFSWGELYYPNNLHKIIIATKVSRIVPSKTKELWPLPTESRIIAATDLVTERNISDPKRITIKTIRKYFPVVQGMSPMYSPDIKLFMGGKQIVVISPSNENKNVIYNTVFYGRGKGIHSTTPFTGTLLKDLLQNYFPLSIENLKSGMMCLVGKDGYRCAVSYSELFNRNDQQEFLLIRTKPEEDGGLFRIFAACDFFSDRAIKSASEIHLGY